MALVAYDFESNSESEDETEDSGSSVVIVSKSEPSKPESKPAEPDVVEESKPENDAVESSIGLFSTLPKTKTSVSTISEDQIEDFIPRPKPTKERQKVKISIPSLSQFDDDLEEEPETKKLKQSTKGSGLIALLPPVKGSVLTNKSFVPNIVANKNKTTNASMKPNSTGLVPNVLRKKAEAKKAQLMKKLSETSAKASGSSDVESDDDMETPETFDEEMWEKVCGRPKPKQVIVEPEESVEETINIAPEPAKPYDGLDNQAFKELVGKTKRPIGNIKLIDINEEEILPDKDLWMTKSLTDPGMAPKHEVDDPVDPTRRKKHHITYLAQQAKANEQELQAAWSASKNNRMASRAKYGF